jgi:hypothetical protein
MIFLEDDILVSPHFLRYMNTGLDRYVDDEKILAICSYKLPFKMPFLYRDDVFLGRRYSPWGVGVWRDKWLKIDLEARDRSNILLNDPYLKSWARSIGADYFQLVKDDSEGLIEALDVRVCFHQMKQRQYCIFPSQSLSHNTGFDGSGMHCGKTDHFDVELDMRPIYSIRFPEKLRENSIIMRRFRDYQDWKSGFVKESVKSIGRVVWRIFHLAKVWLNA